MLTIGLTGNSGCGKSAVADALKGLNCIVCDCDKQAHINMQKNGLAYADIVSEFGTGILRSDGEIDRKKLGAIVFNDKTKLSILNKITHCHITDKILSDKKEAERKKCDFLLVDAPLLIEADMDKLTDVVWVVTADYEERIKRLKERDGITREMAEMRFKNQMPFEEQRKYADVITVTNFETLADLKTAVIKQLNEILEKDLGGSASK
jgi:dephospho-CoA kinase